MKKNKSTKPHPLPETTVIEQAYKSAQYRKNFLEMFRSTTFMLIVVAAFAVLVAILFLPILRIYGKSMKGTLNSGDIVVSVKSGNFETGDVVAFYYNNNILVKRVIAESGDWVDMDEKGNVYVDKEFIFTLASHRDVFLKRQSIVLVQRIFFAKIKRNVFPSFSILINHVGLDLFTAQCLSIYS